MNKIILKGLTLGETELFEFKQALSLYNAELLVLEELNIIMFSPESVALIFQFLQSIGPNVAYDIIKYTIKKINSLLIKNGSKSTNISVTVNGKTDCIYLDFSLDEEQKNKILDAAIEKFLG